MQYILNISTVQCGPSMNSWMIHRYPFIILVSIDLHNLLSFPKGYVSTKTSLKVQTVHSTYHVSVDGAVQFVFVEVIYFMTTYLNFFFIPVILKSLKKLLKPPGVLKKLSICLEWMKDC